MLKTYSPTNHRLGFIMVILYPIYKSLSIISHTAHAVCYCRVENSLGHRNFNSFVKRFRKNIVGVKFVVGNNACDCFGCGDFHVFRDFSRFCVKCAAENPRERQNVIDLIREVAAPRADNLCARLFRDVGQDFGSRVAWQR